MNLQPGTFINSTEALAGTLFADATIFITEYNNRGAVGFIINHPYGRKLNELEEFKKAAPFPLFSGGPVDGEHLFFLHRRPDLVEEGTLVDKGVYLGGNFGQAVEGINEGWLSARDIKIFVGYCGWDAGELEAEIKEGSWEITEAETSLVFS